MCLGGSLGIWMFVFWDTERLVFRLWMESGEERWVGGGC